MNDETVRTMPNASDVQRTAQEMPDAGDLKVRINTLLWESLPGKTTIGAAERIACQFFRAIYQQWD